jgi:NAD(P)H dehydrogenase (quinone)
MANQLIGIAGACGAVGSGMARRLAARGVRRAFAGDTFLLARDQAATEHAILDTGVAHTFLRDSRYLDVVLTADGQEGQAYAVAGGSAFTPGDVLAAQPDALEHVRA